MSKVSEEFLTLYRLWHKFFEKDEEINEVTSATSFECPNSRVAGF